jgi:hypothetical protein
VLCIRCSVLFCDTATLCYCLSSVCCTVPFFLYCTVPACDVRVATIIEVLRAFSSAVRQMPGYNSQRRGTARNS